MAYESWKIICLALLVNHVLANDTCKQEGYNLQCEGISNTFPNIYYGELDLKCKDCSIPTFSSSTFPHDNQLLSFNVSNSEIEYITEDAFAKLYRVAYIDLSGNKIRSLPAGLMSDLKEVRGLSMNDNQLEDLSMNFLEASGVIIVSIERNKLTKIPGKIFEGARSLRDLDLSENAINQIDLEAFVFLRGLERLQLHKNGVCSLPLGVFKYLNGLKYLDLSDNKLTRFPLGIFSGLYNLDTLNLAGNGITDLNGEVFLPLQRLWVLDISRNGIYYLDSHSIYSSVPSIRSFKFSDNLFSCRVLINIVKYFKKMGIDMVSAEGRFDVQNINGVACVDREVAQAIPLSTFFKTAENEAERFRVC